VVRCYPSERSFQEVEGSVTSALVLGGGGVAGIAWELGLLVGLCEAGVPVDDADLVIGTSAGSVVGTYVAAGASLSERFATQTSDAPTPEKSVDVDLEELMSGFAQAMAGTRDPRERRALVGRLALDSSTVSEAERLAIIRSRLPSSDWPERVLRIPAVDTATGDRVVFDRTSGAGLVDAVAASCAVPGVWPPVTIADRRYMDGGIGSIVNADLAADAQRILILAPLAGQEHNPLGTTIDEEVAALEGTARVLVISADQDSAAAFGANPLDPSTRAPSARAGLRQAAGVAGAVRDLWCD
jgi:NTE family protein